MYNLRLLVFSLPSTTFQSMLTILGDVKFAFNVSCLEHRHCNFLPSYHEEKIKSTVSPTCFRDIQWLNVIQPLLCVVSDSHHRLWKRTTECLLSLYWNTEGICRRANNCGLCNDSYQHQRVRVKWSVQSTPSSLIFIWSTHTEMWDCWWC